MRGHTHETKTYPTIGIIGGMGPAATARFYAKLVSLFQDERGAKYNYDFPEMLIHSLAAPDNVEAGVGSPLLDELLSSGRMLARCGVELVALPCNSAHVYIEELRDAVGAPVLNMIEETTREVRASGRRAPLLLATWSTVRTELYPRSDQEGLEFVLPSREHQDEVTEVIMRVCAGDTSAGLQARLFALRSAYPDADCVVLGCTELPLLLPDAHEQGPVFDSLSILARATFRELVEVRDRGEDP